MNNIIKTIEEEISDRKKSINEFTKYKKESENSLAAFNSQIKRDEEDIIKLNKELEEYKNYLKGKNKNEK